MNKYEIKTATADYTGGGIYIFYGQLTNGLYFFTDNDFKEVVILNKEVDPEYIDPDLFENHIADTLTKTEQIFLYYDIIKWIIDNEPKGNYLITELENMIYR